MDKPDDRFARNIGIMTEAQLKQIQETPIGIAGLGMGGSIFLNLVRLGFRRFHVADPDKYEITNVNRQRMAKEGTVGARKDESLIAEARAINPEVEVKSFPEGVTVTNASSFVEGMEFIVDVVDVFAASEKLVLHLEARKRGIPCVSCASLGFGALMVVFDPSTPSFAELSGIASELTPRENALRFVDFIAPEVPDSMREQLGRALRGEGHIPFVVSGVEFAGAMAATEIAKHILGVGERVMAPDGLHLDPIRNRYERYKAFWRARHAPVVPLRKAA
jgi:molybdopterin/thiamine biosynthesis adenylyltransferase